jgi:hypothetical protein
MSTVRGLRKSWWAISRFVRPTATRRRISSSLRVRPPAPDRGRHGAKAGVDVLAGGLEIRGRTVRERARAEFPERAVGARQSLHTQLPLARGDKRGPRACLRERSLEGRLDLAEALERGRELLGRHDRLALGERSSPSVCARAARASSLPKREA